MGGSPRAKAAGRRMQTQAEAERRPHGSKIGNDEQERKQKGTIRDVAG